MYEDPYDIFRIADQFGELGWYNPTKALGTGDSPYSGSVRPSGAFQHRRIPEPDQILATGIHEMVVSALHRTCHPSKNRELSDL